MMRLLFLLSALLSALTGMAGAVRAVEARPAVSAAVAGQQVAPEAAVFAMRRPTESPPGVAAVAGGPMLVRPVLARPALYASRRRE